LPERGIEYPVVHNVHKGGAEMADRVRNVFDMVEIPKEGTLSKVIANTESQNVTLFTMAEREYISPHTSTMEATVLTLKGQADWQIGEEHFIAKEGDWFLMPKNEVHAIRAETPYAFLLSLHK
jgi:quercetin dioxygenase-like cupin family protein